MFNLQSGIHRQRFPSKLTAAQAKKLQVRPISKRSDLSNPERRRRNFDPGEGKHTKAVTGIMVDGLNKTTISCGLDGKVKVRKF